MTNSGSASGWEDLVATFTSAGVPVPPIPAALKPHLDRRDEWFWSTREMDRSELYDPRLINEEATYPVPDYVAIAHVGHGVNSYFVTYQGVFGPVALFAQTGWGGGAYMDNAEQTAKLAAQFESIAKVLDLAESWPEIARLGHRLLVEESTPKDIDICTWLELDGRSQSGLGLLRRTALGTTAITRAAERLDPRVLEDSRAPRDTVDVAVEMDWEEIGPVELVGDTLVFPPDLPKQPGLYRFRFVRPDGERVYVGEASDLHRRGGHYRLGNPTGATNKRLHDAMHKHLGPGSHIEMAIALGGIVIIDGYLRPLDLRRKMSRLLAEGAALHSIPPEQLLNLPGIGDR